MKDPTCPNDAKYYDYFHDDPVAKRSLMPRQDECAANGNFVRLVQWMARLLQNEAIAYQFTELTEIWDNVVAGSLDTGLEFGSLERQRELTHWDSLAFTNDVMLNIQDAGPGIREYQAASPLICENFGSRRKRDLPGADIMVRGPVKQSFRVNIITNPSFLWNRHFMKTLVMRTRRKSLTNWIVVMCFRFPGREILIDPTHGIS